MQSMWIVNMHKLELIWFCFNVGMNYNDILRLGMKSISALYCMLQL